MTKFLFLNVDRVPPHLNMYKWYKLGSGLFAVKIRNKSEHFHITRDWSIVFGVEYESRYEPDPMTRVLLTPFQ